MCLISESANVLLKQIKSNNVCVCMSVGFNTPHRIRCMSGMQGWFNIWHQSEMALARRDANFGLCLYRRIWPQELMNPGKSSQNTKSSETGSIEESRSLVPLYFSHLFLNVAQLDGNTINKPPLALLPKTLLSYLTPLIRKFRSYIVKGTTWDCQN